MFYAAVTASSAHTLSVPIFTYCVMRPMQNAVDVSGSITFYDICTKVHVSIITMHEKKLAILGYLFHLQLYLCSAIGIKFTIIITYIKEII